MDAAVPVPIEGGSGPELHVTLRRQLLRLGLSEHEMPDPRVWSALLDRISASYASADNDRYVLERSLAVSSEEMAELYEQLRATSESRLAIEHARLLTVTDHFPIGILEIDAQGHLLFENPEWQGICGRSLLESAETIYAVVDELDRPALRAAILEAGPESQESVLTVRLRAPGGARWVRLRMRSLRPPGADEGDGRWFVSAADVTDEVEARESMDRLSALLEAATDVVVVFDPEGLLLHVNRVGRDLLGVVSEGAVRGRSLFELFDPVSAERVRHEAMPQLHAGGQWKGEATLLGGEEPMPTSLVLLAHTGRGGRVEYCSAIARDITGLKAAQQALVREATHDSLTGLPNRVLLLDRLDHAIRRADRTGATLAVLYVDLDRFKMVNDSLGHDVGDRLIISAAARLASCVRSSDTVARLGGDEFVIVAEDVADPHEAERLAAAIVTAFQEPFDLMGAEAFVSASVGIATSVDVGDTAAGLLRNADVAMYRAKEQGRARHERYDSAMHASVTRRFELEAALRHALDRGEIDVHYQPQVEVGTGRVVGFEALARWNHPTEGAISPSVFIPLAEENGLIARIGAAVLGRASRDAAGWVPNGPGAQVPTSVSVNVSARQLTQPGLVPSVERILREHGLDSGALILEITESVLVQDPTVAQARLEALRDLGIRIAIDDFGKGYSSLAYLQRFPLDIVKIDQLFLSDLDEMRSEHTIVASIIDLAHTLGLQVVAEGVERVAQLDALARLDCDLIQGFVVSPAVPASSVGSWLARHWKPSRKAQPVA